MANPWPCHGLVLKKRCNIIDHRVMVSPWAHHGIFGRLTHSLSDIAIFIIFLGNIWICLLNILVICIDMVFIRLKLYFAARRSILEEQGLKVTRDWTLEAWRIKEKKIHENSWSHVMDFSYTTWHGKFWKMSTQKVEIIAR